MIKDISTDRLLKIGVFYDGNYFLHVSNFYNYVHQRRSRLSIAGLHEFISAQLAQEEGRDSRHCKIVDAHYFRGRLNAQEASQKGNLLYYDRVFDDILMSEGVVTHYLPIRTFLGRREEKGVEVWLSLEAYELAHYKDFDVVVLIASDGDYVPLVRKLNTLGTRVMLLHWEFEFTNDEGQRIVTRTSSDLATEVTYSMPLHQYIDGKVKTEANINNLFVQAQQNMGPRPMPDYPMAYPGAMPARAEALPAEKQPPRPAPGSDEFNSAEFEEGAVGQGEIISLKNGYGFIKYPPNNLFFHFTNLLNIDFSELQEGDRMEFTMERNEQGNPVAKNITFIAPAEDVG